MRTIQKVHARLVRLEPRHAAIVPYLRQADVDEITAASGGSPKVAVAYSIVASRPGWAVELDGKPIVLFGASPALKKIEGEYTVIGSPWLVGTDEIEKYPVHFFRVSKDLIGVMKARYSHLENWTDERNTLSLRWLEWAGFVIEPAAPYGPYGKRFHRFWWKR